MQGFDLHGKQGKLCLRSDVMGRSQEAACFLHRAVLAVQSRLAADGDSCLHSRSKIWIQTKPCCQYRREKRLAACFWSLCFNASCPSPVLFQSGSFPEVSYCCRICSFYFSYPFLWGGWRVLVQVSDSGLDNNGKEDRSACLLLCL